MLVKIFDYATMHCTAAHAVGPQSGDPAALHLPGRRSGRGRRDRLARDERLERRSRPRAPDWCAGRVTDGRAGRLRGGIGHGAEVFVHTPRERPMISFMISVVPP